MAERSYLDVRGTLPPNVTQSPESVRKFVAAVGGRMRTETIPYEIVVKVLDADATRAVGQHEVVAVKLGGNEIGAYHRTTEDAESYVAGQRRTQPSFVDVLIEVPLRLSRRERDSIEAHHEAGLFKPQGIRDDPIQGVSFSVYEAVAWATRHDYENVASVGALLGVWAQVVEVARWKHARDAVVSVLPGL